MPGEPASPGSPEARRKDAYEWLKVLGYGASGKVWLVRSKDTGQECAVKRMIKADCVREPAMLAMVKNERAILTRLDHPNVIKLVECFQTADELFYVLEKGGNELLSYIKMCHHLELSQIRTIAAELVSGLEYLHGVGVVHRDLKPENVLLNDRNHVKIIDFGTAFMEAAEAEKEKEKQGRLPRGKTFCGSTHYLSPEVCDGETAGPPSDLWALGCILYHMATGRRPFEGSMVEVFEKLRSPEQYLTFPADCPPAVRDLCQQLLRKDPTTRLGAEQMGGYQKLREHNLFAGIDFASLPNAELMYQWHPVAASWVHDCDGANCRKCGLEFSMTRRKHHCRRCGQIFCGKCSANREVVPGLFRGEKVRLCDSCTRVVQSQAGVAQAEDPSGGGDTETKTLTVTIGAGEGQWAKGKGMFCELKLKRVLHGMVNEGVHPKAQKQVTRTVTVPDLAPPKWNQQFTFRVPVQDALRISVFFRALKKTKVGQLDLRFAEVIPLLTPGKPLTNSYPLKLSKEQDGGRARDRDQTGVALSVSLMLPHEKTQPIPDVDVEFVEFEAVRDPPAVLRFTAEGDALKYVIDGQEDSRPPFRKIEFNGSLRIRFPCIKTAAVVPQAQCIEILAGLRCLAKKAGVEHNIPDQLDPADAALRTRVRRATQANAPDSPQSPSSPTKGTEDEDEESDVDEMEQTRGLSLDESALAQQPTTSTDDSSMPQQQPSTVSTDA
eukprot:Hpha_TRINITY_DN10837_c0_g1::TRINITY_DN10837_c0_g1_i1::g.23481::m.23481/K06276/PDPK1; 3-phosphoinositide dependent protein kinase-1